MCESDYIVEEARLFDVELDATQAELMLEHLNLVEEVNKHINLTRITSRESAVLLHILDSLLLVPYFRGVTGAFLDMGTGAGFPGIPVHIATGMKGVLVDSVGKKVDAVQSFIQQLGLTGLTAEHVRLEEFAQKKCGCFSIVTARALASLPVLIEYAAPLLKHNGRLVVTKGHPTHEERERGLAAAKICGLELESVDDYELPQDAGHRCIITYRSVRKPRLKLPRATGKASHEPLA